MFVDDELISPCMCKGTQQFVHRSCLNHWWSAKVERSFDPFTFYFCIGAIQFLVLAGFARLMMQRIGLGNDPRVAAFQSLILELGLFDISRESIFEFVASVIVSFVFFVIVGIVFSVLTIAFAVQGIWQRQYDVLNKKQLTEEYVVEDINGTYTPPVLDPEHERRLRTLNLM